MVSLFSGAGGMDLGFTLTGGFRSILANDILTPPAQTYALNFGHHIVDIREDSAFKKSSPVYLIGDVADLDFKNFKESPVDLVVGGPPCQDFSVVRGPSDERKGIDVVRGRLYAQFVRVLIHLQPKVFVFENVPGLKSANRGAAYKAILEDFTELKIRWEEIKRLTGNHYRSTLSSYSIVFSDIVDSAFLGVPQKRKRLIVIGAREDLLRHCSLFDLKQEAERVLFGRGSLLGRYPLTPLEVFEGLPLPELDREYKAIMMEYRDLEKGLPEERIPRWENFKKLTFDVVRDYLALNDIAGNDSREADKAFEEHRAVLKKLGYYNSRVEGKFFLDKSNILPNEKEAVLERLKMIPPGENHSFVKGTRWEVEGKGMSLIYRRLHPLIPSYTVVAYGGGGTWGYHYKRDRGRLTNRERARLQTFPDWFLFSGSTSEIRAQIGEAVPPLLGEKIAEVVKIILTEISGTGK